MKKQNIVNKLHKPVHPKVSYIVLAATVVLAFTGLLAILQFLNSSNQSIVLQNSTTPTPSITPTLTPLPPTPYPKTDITSPWKMYTNTDVGFSIQYPANWTKQDNIYQGQNIGGSVSGKEGSIRLLTGSFGGSGCIVGTFVTDGKVTGKMTGIETVHVNGEVLPACHVTLNDDIEGWTFYNTRSYLQIDSSVNAPSETNRNLVLEILSTLKFTKP